MTDFVQKLFAGPLDIVGDVHGEIEALTDLVANLGYQPDGHHPEGRRLVFVGDLVDRGPDSVAVVEQVSRWIDAGTAQCVLGNHEFNLQRGYHRHGNEWFYGDSGSFASREARDADRDRIRAFINTLPVALERNGLRVVHACWDPESVARLGDVSTDLSTFDQWCAARIDQLLDGEGVLDLARREYRQHHEALLDPSLRPPLLPNVAAKDWRRQMGSPVRMLTSGQEGPISRPFFASGKWRMVGRLPWWQTFQEQTPTIIGHYWRSSAPHTSVVEQDPLADVPPFAWMGPKKSVFCVDYSVGRRHHERRRGEKPYQGRLAALRVPDWTLHFDDGEQLFIGKPGPDGLKVAPSMPLANTLVTEA